MKWKTIKHGDTRIIKRFAWLPISLSNGSTIWLEKYKREETYFAYPLFSWIDTRTWQE